MLAALSQGLRRVPKGYCQLGVQSAALVLGVPHDSRPTTQLTNGRARLGLTFPFLRLNGHEPDCSAHLAPEHFDPLTVTVSSVSYVTAQVRVETARACPHPNLLKSSILCCFSNPKHFHIQI